jgi:hypothetical protein
MVFSIRNSETVPVVGNVLKARNDCYKTFKFMNLARNASSNVGGLYKIRTDGIYLEVRSLGIFQPNSPIISQICQNIRPGILQKLYVSLIPLVERM